MNNENEKIDIVIIVPQKKEYDGIKNVFSVNSEKSFYLPHGGTYETSKIELKNSSYKAQIAIACMNGMYNYRCLSIMERIILKTEPKIAFLVGSACGNLSKVNILDVVVSTDFIAYLGRGRRSDGTVNERPYTQPIDPIMEEAINEYMMRKNTFNQWKKNSKKILESNCTNLPENIREISAFEIKTGSIASDDIVISWSNKELANNFWRTYIGDESKAYDMESAGFSHACSWRTTNKPNWAVIRGISDHGFEADKYHLEAATIAAAWLLGFITEEAGRLLGIPPQSEIKIDISATTTDWNRLYSLLDKEEKKNIFVGKRRFIMETLVSNNADILALNHAINDEGIYEYELENPKKTGRSTTAIRLDKGSPFWYGRVQI